MSSDCCKPCCGIAAYGESGGFALLYAMIFGINADAAGLTFEVGLYGGLAADLATNGAAVHTPGGGEVANANPVTADYLEIETADYPAYARQALTGFTDPKLACGVWQARTPPYVFGPITGSDLGALVTAWGYFVVVTAGAKTANPTLVWAEQFAEPQTLFHVGDFVTVYPQLSWPLGKKCC